MSRGPERVSDAAVLRRWTSAARSCGARSAPHLASSTEILHFTSLLGCEATPDVLYSHHTFFSFLLRIGRELISGQRFHKWSTALKKTLTSYARALKGLRSELSNCARGYLQQAISKPRSAARSGRD